MNVNGKDPFEELARSLDAFRLEPPRKPLSDRVATGLMTWGCLTLILLGMVLVAWKLFHWAV